MGLNQKSFLFLVGALVVATLVAQVVYDFGKKMSIK